MKRIIGITSIILLAIIIGIWYFNTSKEQEINIPSGYIGIIENHSEGIKDTILNVGDHLIAKDNRVYILRVFDIKQSIKMDAELKTKDITSIEIDTRFDIVPTSAPEIIKAYGENFQDMYIVPTYFQTIRKIVGQYGSSQLKRDTLVTRFLHDLDNNEEFSKMFTLKAVFVRNITNPTIIKTANKAGLEKEYDLLRTSDPETRKQILKKLINLNTEESMLIVLNHWDKETNQDVRDYMLKILTNQNK